MSEPAFPYFAVLIPMGCIAGIAALLLESEVYSHSQYPEQDKIRIAREFGSYIEKPNHFKKIESAIQKSELAQWRPAAGSLENSKPDAELWMDWLKNQTAQNPNAGFPVSSENTLDWIENLDPVVQSYLNNEISDPNGEFLQTLLENFLQSTDLNNSIWNQKSEMWIHQLIQKLEPEQRKDFLDRKKMIVQEKIRNES